MKNVWIINHYAQQSLGPGSTRHYSLAKHLKLLGWKVSIVAASTELNTGIQRLEKGELRRIERYEDVPFLWLRAPTYTGNGVGRIINMLAFSYRALMPGNMKMLDRPDVIVGSSVHLAAALSGCILAKRFGVPFVFEVRDLWPQTLIDIGRLGSGSLVVKVLKFVEKYLYKRAHKIVVLLPYASEYIVPLGIPETKIVWIPNGVDIADYPAPSQPDKNTKFTLMYVGAHGSANALHVVLKAMKCLETRHLPFHVELVLIGDGAQKRDLMKQAVNYRLHNVKFLDAIPKQEVPGVLRKADAFILSVGNHPKLYRYGISMNKLYDYMAAGRPTIIATNASNNPILESGGGLTVLPEDPAALADAIEELVSMSPEKLSNLGCSARRWVEKYHSYEKLAIRFSEVLDQVVSARAD